MALSEERILTARMESAGEQSALQVAPVVVKIT